MIQSQAEAILLTAECMSTMALRLLTKMPVHAENSQILAMIADELRTIHPEHEPMAPR
jgi:hypothetical protein